MNLPVNNNSTSAPVNRNLPVQGAAPAAPPKVNVIDGSNVQAYKAQGSTVFDASRSGMPAPGYPPARSSPNVQAGLDEIEQLMKTANNSDSNSVASFSAVMAQVKMMALKNREDEMSVRDKLRLAALDLKFQAIEKDKEAAKTALKSALVKGVFEGVSAGITVVGGIKQIGAASRGLKAGTESPITQQLEGSLAQGFGSRYSGSAQAVSAGGTIATGFLDKEVADRRAEAEKLRATADNINQLSSQAGDRMSLNRDLILDTNSAEKSANDAVTQAANKRFSV
jgi:hypothetical protein